MKRILFIFLSLIFVATSVSAQRARFELSFKSSVPADVSTVYIQPLDVADDIPSVPMRLKDDVYTGSVPVSTSGFYEVVMVINGGQWLATVYSPKNKKVELAVEFDGQALAENSGVDNRALSALNTLILSNSRKLWLVNGMSDKELMSLMRSHVSVKDSIIKTCCPAPAVVDYMNAWAYTASQSFYTSIPRAQKRKLKDLSFVKEDVLSPCDSILDNENAALLPAAVQHVFASIADKSQVGLDGMLSALYDGYKCEAVRVKVADMIMSRFLSRHSYAMDFDGGLECMKRVVDDFDLSDKYIDEYLKHEAVLIGADFPESVVLVDLDGEEVDFSTFKGKYVYVDLWASWCGPCCREVPHLQALEKELEGSDVVFVSISTDTDQNAWKSKVAELGMHGNQFFDRDNELGSVLNVGGIPFFLIYDKNGKLHTYGAMRPSAGEQLKEFLLNLK